MSANARSEVSAIARLTSDFFVCRCFWLASCWQHEPRGGVELNAHSLFAVLLFCCCPWGVHTHLYSVTTSMAMAILAQVELSDHCNHQ